MTERKHQPIYGTDLSVPYSQTVEGLRSKIANIRGQLYDIGYDDAIWKSRLAHVEGLLTCGLVVLHGVVEEMRSYEAKWPKSPQPASDVGGPTK